VKKKIKYPQIMQISVGDVSCVWGEKKSRPEDHIRSAEVILSEPRRHFVLGTIIQRLGPFQESFEARYDLWPYPKPLKKSA
jgi:hypothetical protein